MNIIINNVDVDKILITKKINVYKLYYNHNSYYRILGIPIKVKYKYISIHNNLYYIFLDENNDDLIKLNNYFNNIIDDFLFIRNNITNKFIICNNYNKVKINSIKNNENNFIYININKIKYIKNNNIPIINILI